jgi:hypothetical protein
MGEAEAETEAEESKTVEEKTSKVRFFGRVQFKTIRHVNDFSEEEIIEGWYRKRDYAKMSEEVSKIAKLVAKGKDVDGRADLCIRGLEHLVEEDVADYRAEKMIASVDAVLDQQEDQRNEEIFDPEIIAKIYAEIAAPLQKEAYLVALRDALAATEAMEEMDKPKEKEKEKKTKSKKKSSKKTPKSSKIYESNESDTSGTYETCEESTPEEGSPEEETPEERGSQLEVNDNLSSSVHTENVKALEPSRQVPLPPRDWAPEQSTQSEDALPPPPPPTKTPTPTKRTRTRLDRSGGTELSPLVRKLDGTFAFRNRELDRTKMELSKERRLCVKASLFKHLDSPQITQKKKVGPAAKFKGFSKIQ